jgi:shikimate dehydrogenase
VEWAKARGTRVRLAVPPLVADVVVNTTPLGHTGDDSLPINPTAVRDLRVGLDLVYRSGETRWVRALRDAGITARDGRGMLVRQGALAWARFFPAHPAPMEVMRAAVERALRG